MATTSITCSSCGCIGHEDHHCSDTLRNYADIHQPYLKHFLQELSGFSQEYASKEGTIVVKIGPTHDYPSRPTKHMLIVKASSPNLSYHKPFLVFAEDLNKPLSDDIGTIVEPFTKVLPETKEESITQAVSLLKSLSSNTNPTDSNTEAKEDGDNDGMCDSPTRKKEVSPIKQEIEEVGKEILSIILPTDLDFNKLLSGNHSPSIRAILSVSALSYLLYSSSPLPHNVGGDDDQ